jgi:hypothetical protein
MIKFNQMKKFKSLFFSLVLSLLFTTQLFSQTNISQNNITKYSEMVQLAEGTYQIQMIDTRSLPSIPLSLIETIEAKRDVSKVIYFQYKQNIRIKILSKEMINKPDFIPLVRIISISSNDI